MTKVLKLVAKSQNPGYHYEIDFLALKCIDMGIYDQDNYFTCGKVLKSVANC